MDNDNSVNRDILDDDIMQCRVDILRNRNKSKGVAPVNPVSTNLTADNLTENPIQRSDVAAGRVKPFAAKSAETISDAADTSIDEKNVRIPKFEELITQTKQPVEAKWETPLKIEPETELENVMIEQVESEEINEVGFELDPANLITDEEEAALFPADENEQLRQDDGQSEELATEEGLDALRKVVAEASKEAEAELDEFDELEGIEDLMVSEEIEELVIDQADIEEDAKSDDEPVVIADAQDSLKTPEGPESIESEKQNEPADETVDVGIETETEAETKPEEPASGGRMVPKFDLAEKILKEQRHVASKRRQRPGGSRNLNVMPIAGTVGQIIEEAKRAVSRAAKKFDAMPQTQASQVPEEIVKNETVSFDKMEIEKIEEDHLEPALSVAACQVITESDRLNPFQEDIIIDIVSRDIARFCGELEKV